MVKISIIMPLYNAEKYLPEALQSVLKQTYKDFELICVDDCSSDRTGEILSDFQGQDRRIKILFNERRLGAGRSRNRGLERAEGKYVLFLDGDDVFEEELLEKTYAALEESEADVVIFKYMRVPSEAIYIKKIKKHPKWFVESYCSVPFSVGDFSPRDFPNYSNSPCDKMFRKDFLLENQLEFQDLPAFNDVYFAKMTSYCAKRIIYLNDDRIMVYARKHSQPSRISNNRRDPMFGYYAMERLAVELKEREMFHKLAEYYYYTFLNTIMDLLIVEEKDKECQKHFYNFLKDIGIEKCIQYGEDSYAKVDQYEQNLLRGIQSHTWESGWFRSLDTYFQFYLKRDGERLCRWVEEQKMQGKKIVVWGAGVNGQVLLEYIREKDLRIFGVVDSDEKKLNIVISGYKVSRPELMAKEADYIMVTSKKIYQEIEDIAAEWQAAVVNALDMVLEDSRGNEVQG